MSDCATNGPANKAVLDITSKSERTLSKMAGGRKPTRAPEATRIRSLARSGAIFFSDHALMEMAKDGLDLPDLLCLMGSCRIVEEQPNSRYRVEGRTADGVAVVAICRVETVGNAGQRVFVIPVWKVRTR